MKIQCEISPEAINAIDQLVDLGLKAYEPNVNRTDILLGINQIKPELLMTISADIERIKRDNGL